MKSSGPETPSFFWSKLNTIIHVYLHDTMDRFGQPQEHSQLSVLGILRPSGINTIYYSYMQLRNKVSSPYLILKLE